MKNFGLDYLVFRENCTYLHFEKAQASTASEKTSSTVGRLRSLILFKQLNYSCKEFNIKLENIEDSFEAGASF